ncbi:hypothetical protein HMPREF2829_02780 [Aerococcus sp. HMSC072A12]|nr:DNA/RNA non-specific endonuclease [Aerococcus sp. UMB8487]OFK21808.1 hypothetical protein HMPREF2829_02780 [Aerococcus sp. HMSC072A12]OFT41351.1 hypothetical protein HMPREF3161_03535 [Aerococcus sp. HMSC06H08]
MQVRLIFARIEADFFADGGSGMQVIFSLILLLSLGFMFYYWQRSLTKRRITAFTALNGVLGLIATNDLKAALATFAVLSAIFSALNIRRNKRWRNLAVMLAVVSTVMLLVVSAAPTSQSLPDREAPTASSRVQSSGQSGATNKGASRSESGDDRLHYPELPAQTEGESGDLPGKDRTAPPAPHDPEAEAGGVVPQVPADQAYVAVNSNIPHFSNEDISSTQAYEDYGQLDTYGRVTAANAVLGQELMPDEDRGDISAIRPTGWKQAKYPTVDGGWLYNRSHLIGYQLTGENANIRNLMTGTRYFNVEGMLPFENYVANYIEETGNHVRYRVTPVFEGENMLASGVYMEAFSIEDNGAGIKFNVFVPNRQPQVAIDYRTGASRGQEGPLETDDLPSLPKE